MREENEEERGEEEEKKTRRKGKTGGGGGGGGEKREKKKTPTDRESNADANHDHTETTDTKGGIDSPFNLKASPLARVDLWRTAPSTVASWGPPAQGSGRGL